MGDEGKGSRGRKGAALCCEGPHFGSERQGVPRSPLTAPLCRAGMGKSVFLAKKPDIIYPLTVSHGGEKSEGGSELLPRKSQRCAYILLQIIWELSHLHFCCS